MSRQLTIPDYGLVVLIGAAGAGKTTFAERSFGASEVLSSDHYRSVVGDGERSARTTRDAFDIIEQIARRRLRARLLTVIDATNVQDDDRKRWVEIARGEHAPVSAIVLDLNERDCQEQNAGRGDGARPGHVVRRQWRALQRSVKLLSKQGYRRRSRLRSPTEALEAQVVREPLDCDIRTQHGPFDVIGDVHGCRAELEALLARLGYRVEAVEATADGDGPHYEVTPPAGRRAVFVGDIADRGPDSAGALALVMDAVAAGAALAIPGNHDSKLARAIEGAKVERKHGLEQTLEQIGKLPAAFAERVRAFIRSLPSHYVADGGNLVIAHAGMPEALQNRVSGAVRHFGLFGDVSGETDADGLPERRDWARDYRGEAHVVYGHTATARPEWVNNTICIDTGCAFGGRLTALRWPERELVDVEAERTYAEPKRPLATATGAKEQQSDSLLDVEDVTAPMRIETRLAGSVAIGRRQGEAALELLSRFAVDPRWLIYVPPTMSPCDSARAEGLLEHPAEAFGYFRARNVREVMCEEKHMGSRAVIVAARSREAARERFGIDAPAAGCIYTRTGQPFWHDAGIEKAVLDQVRAAMEQARLWDELATDWVCLDAEVMPWSAKGQGLIERHYEPVAAASRMGLAAALGALRAPEAGEVCAELAERYESRAAMAAAYDEAYRRYSWPTDGIEGLQIAPFHLLATEGAVHADKPHAWHMETLARLYEHAAVLSTTEHRVVDVDDDAEVAAATTWWTERTGAGAEGMVVKPAAFVTRGERGLVAPALKVRGREYLRIIYGPEYTSADQLERLRRRNTSRKMGLAIREFALGIEGLEAFVGREPLRRVHAAAFGVLALESEPLDPRF